MKITKLNIVDKIGKDPKAVKYLIKTMTESKKRILVDSFMNTGKTTNTMKDLYPALKERKELLIFILPTVSLVMSVRSDFPNTILCKQGEEPVITADFKPILSTPDSMRKIVEKCEKSNIKFKIVYDEFHLVINQAGFRESVYKALDYYDHHLCTGLTGLTATANFVKVKGKWKHTQWDEIIEIEPKIKTQQAKTLELLYNFKHSLENMTGLILETTTNNDCKARLLIRLNNKKQIEYIAAEIEKRLPSLKVDKWFSGMNDPKDIESHRKAMQKEKIDYDIILTTCYNDVGIEIYPAEEVINNKEILHVTGRPLIIIDFLTQGTDLLDVIQQTTRIRTGVDKIIMTTNKTLESTHTIRSFNAILEEQEEGAENLQVFANITKAFMTKDLNNEWLERTGDKGFYRYSVIEARVRKTAQEEFMENILNNPHAILNFMKQQRTLNIPEYEMKEAKEYTVKDLEKFNNKRLSEEEIQEINNFRDRTKECADNEIVEIIKPREIELEERFQYLKDDREFYLSPVMASTRYHMNRCADLMDITKIKSFRIFLEHGAEKIMQPDFNFQTIVCSTIFDNIKRERIRGMYKGVKYLQIVTAIRESMVELFGKEIDTGIGKINQKKLLEYIQKNKCLPKLTANNLDKHLNAIYKKDKQNKVSSIITFN